MVVPRTTTWGVILCWLHELNYWCVADMGILTVRSAGVGRLAKCLFYVITEPRTALGVPQPVGVGQIGNFLGACQTWQVGPFPSLRAGFMGVEHFVSPGQFVLGWA